MENNNSVTLYWQAASENNSEHFDIEQSNDGISFYYEGMVAAAGYCNSVGHTVSMITVRSIKPLLFFTD
ncbi:MAG: hypothetical protein ABJA78_17675 [Ferruginibacter sp.]